MTSPHLMSSHPARNRGPRATPPLQTNHAPSPNARYSYLETPVEMQRGVFHQFSSPTNSTIDESPISPASSSRAPPSYQPGSHPGIPEEKSHVLPLPEDAHPAYHAPYKDATPVDQQAPQLPIPAQPQSPGPMPIKYEPDPVRSAVPTPPPQPHTTQLLSSSPVSHREPYDPNSLQGPNVDPSNHRPGQIAHPNSLIDPHWKHSLCELDTLCITSLVCPCIIYGKTMYRLSRKSSKADPTDLLGYESCNGPCGLMTVACGFQWLLAAIHRTRIRKLYKIEGGVGDDCVKGLCCCCCVVALNEREVRSREEATRQFAGPVTGQYATPTGGMQYAPPPRG